MQLFRWNCLLSRYAGRLNENLDCLVSYNSWINFVLILYPFFLLFFNHCLNFLTVKKSTFNLICFPHFLSTKNTNSKGQIFYWTKLNSIKYPNLNLKVIFFAAAKFTLKSFVWSRKSRNFKQFFKFNSKSFQIGIHTDRMDIFATADPALSHPVPFYSRF